MSFTTIDYDFNYISQLSDLPNDQDGLTAAQLKAKYDLPGQQIKSYINVTMLPELEDAINAAAQGHGGGTIGTSMITDQAITYDKLMRTSGSEAVNTGALRDGAVTTDKLGASAVTAAKIADETITLAKLSQTSGYEAVDSAAIRAKCVTTAKLADGAVTSDKMASSSVATASIADSAVTNAKIADETIAKTKLAFSVTDAGKLKIGDTEYTLRTGTEGAAGYITFVTA